MGAGNSLNCERNFDHEGLDLFFSYLLHKLLINLDWIGSEGNKVKI